MKKIGQEGMRSLVVAAVVFVIGVLFCCSMSMGLNGLSWLIGFSLMVAGILYFVNSIAHKKALATMEGVIGAAIFAFGIFFIANGLAGLIMAYIPWLLMSLGAVVVIDAFLKKFVRKEDNVSKFVVELLFGAACLALGLCLRFVNGFGDFTALVLGIVMIVYAVFLVFGVYTKKDVVAEITVVSVQPVEEIGEVEEVAATEVQTEKEPEKTAKKKTSAKTGTAKTTAKTSTKTTAKKNGTTANGGKKKGSSGK